MPQPTPQARLDRSRRAFVRLTGAAFLGGSAAAIAACGGGKKGTTETTISTTQAQGDAAVLNAALELEHTAIAAYGVGARLTRGKVLQFVHDTLAQEREHAAALAKAIGGLGTAPVKPRPQRAYEAGFPKMRDAAAFLNFALDVENTAVAAYLDSLSALNTGYLKSDATAIATTEAEHLSVIYGLLGRPQVPNSFVTGESPA